MSLTIRDIHIRIEQGLQNIGVFAYDDFEHDEIDIHINSVIKNEFRKVVSSFDDRGNPRSVDNIQYYSDFVRQLKENIILEVAENKNYYSAILPSDYGHLISDDSCIVDNKCNSSKYTLGFDSVLESGLYYQAVGDVKTSDRWYDDCSIIVPDDDTETVIIGSVKEVSVIFRANRLTKSEDVRNTLQTRFSTTTMRSPVSELIGNTIKIYTESKFTICGVSITYLRIPKSVSYVDGITIEEFSEDTVNYLIDKTIQRLSILTEQNQNKVVGIQNEFLN
jgi:hypothetical protein